jgi:hypothetical protein
MRVMNGKGNSLLEGAGGGGHSALDSGMTRKSLMLQFVSFHFTRFVPRFLRSVNYRKRDVYPSSACVTI